MKRLVCALLACSAAAAASAAVVSVTERGVLVAQNGSAAMFDRTGANLLWSTGSVATPEKIIASNDRAAVVDPLANEVTIVDLVTGRGATMHTGETPIDGLFAGDALYLLERDARAIERISIDGMRTSVTVGPDSAFLRQANGRLYVYSRADGMIQEITISPFRVARRATVAPFASDFEIDGRNAYLVNPRAAKIGVISLASMTSTGNIAVGAVPVDMTFVSPATALTASTLAVADPSAKRVWMIEGAQSFAQAFARGFLRGLLGVGLFGRRASQFPTGVDRVMAGGSRWYAYDSSSGTLYRFTKSKSSIVAKDVAPQGFGIGPNSVYVWDDAVRRLQRIAIDE